MKLDDFVSPARLAPDCSFVGSSPLVKDVLAHLLFLMHEADNHRKGKWSISELYNTAASDIIALYTEHSSPAEIKQLKPNIVE